MEQAAMGREEIVDALSELLPHYGWRRAHERTPDGGMATRTLHKLYHAGDRGTSPGELRQALGVSGARVTAILNELESKGLIARSTAALDRRGVVITLTDAGAAAMEERGARRRARAERFVSRVGEADAATLVRLLRAAREMEDEESAE